MTAIISQLANVIIKKATLEHLVHQSLRSKGQNYPHEVLIKCANICPPTTLENITTICQISFTKPPISTATLINLWQIKIA